MKNKYELSPLDSWLGFSPGKGMTLTPTLQEKWIQKARDFRKLPRIIALEEFDCLCCDLGVFGGGSNNERPSKEL